LLIHQAHVKDLLNVRLVLELAEIVLERLLQGASLENHAKNHQPVFPLMYVKMLLQVYLLVV
jgi:hypothetical protein